MSEPHGTFYEIACSIGSAMSNNIGHTMKTVFIEFPGR
jgi:hypothetical protein